MVANAPFPPKFGRLYEGLLPARADDESIKPPQDGKLQDALRARNTLSQIRVDACTCLTEKATVMGDLCSPLWPAKLFAHSVSKLHIPTLDRLLKSASFSIHSHHELVAFLMALVPVSKLITELHEQFGDHLEDWPRGVGKPFALEVEDFPIAREWLSNSILESLPNKAEELTSLANSKEALRSALMRLQGNRGNELMAKWQDSAEAYLTSDQMESDPLSTLLFGLAVSNAIDIIIEDPDEAAVYRVERAAFEQRDGAFSAWKSLSTGKLVLCPSLFSNRSAEVKLEGSALRVSISQLREAIGQRPTSEAELDRVAKKVIQIALIEGECLTKTDFIARVKKEVFGLSKDRIIKVGWKKHAPKTWKAAGPKKSRVAR